MYVYNIQFSANQMNTRVSFVDLQTDTGVHLKVMVIDPRVLSWIEVDYFLLMKC